MKRHSPEKLLDLSRQLALQSKWAKRRGQHSRAQELLSISRYCWKEATQDPNPLICEDCHDHQSPIGS